MLASSQLKTYAAQCSWSLRWIIGTGIGFGLAGALFHNFPLAYAPAYLTRLGAFSLLPAIVGFFFGGIPALLSGWAQWTVLRRALSLSRWWILSVSPGMGIMHFLSDGFDSARDLTLAVAIGGLTVGLVQWILLRPFLPQAGWWMTACVAGWVLGRAAGIAILRAAAMLYLPWVPGLEVRQHGILGMTAGLAYGLITGLLLVRLLASDRGPQATSPACRTPPAPAA